MLRLLTKTFAEFTLIMTASYPCFWILGQDERPEGHRRRRTAKLEKKYGHLLRTTK